MKVSTIFLKDHLPKPTGPYRIGTAKYDLEDVYRKDFQFPNGRLLPIQIYFPMEQGSHAIFPKIFEFLKILQRLFVLCPEFFDG